MTLDEEIRRADECERLMSNPLLKGAFDGIEAGLIANLKACAMADITTQHELALSLQLLGQLQKHFKTHMQTGQMARQQKESLAEKALRVIRRA